MEESCVSPGDEQVVDEVHSESSISNLSEEKQKAVLLKYIQVCILIQNYWHISGSVTNQARVLQKEKRDLQEQLDIKEKTIQEYRAKVYDLTNQLEQSKKSATKSVSKL